MDIIVKTLYEAVEKSFKRLFLEHKNEHFYYCTLVMADAATPCISAQSKESLNKYLNEIGVPESESIYYKWSWADSPYCAYGYDKYFSSVEELFEKRFEETDDEETEYNSWLNAMETVMKMLDDIGFFGVGKTREEIFIFAEESPPDDENDEYFERARRMNSKTAYTDWYNECYSDNIE